MARDPEQICPQTAAIAVECGAMQKSKKTLLGYVFRCGHRARQPPHKPEYRRAVPLVDRKEGRMVAAAGIANQLCFGFRVIRKYVHILHCQNQGKRYANSFLCCIAVICSLLLIK
jgi:hypothetical protein